MKWQSNKFPKKQYLQFCKFFNLPYYKKWKIQNNKKKRASRKRLGEKANPNFSRNMKLILADKYGYLCSHCGTSTYLELDHIKPLFAGGGNEIENLQLLCTICHRVKTKQDFKLSTLYSQSGK